MEKLPSTGLALGATKVGDHCPEVLPDLRQCLAIADTQFFPTKLMNPQLHPFEKGHSKG